jgi:hypothetical protein
MIFTPQCHRCSYPPPRRSCLLISSGPALHITRNHLRHGGHGSGWLERLVTRDGPLAGPGRRRPTPAQPAAARPAVTGDLAATAAAPGLAAIKSAGTMRMTDRMAQSPAVIAPNPSVPASSPQLSRSLPPNWD